MKIIIMRHGQPIINLTAMKKRQITPYKLGKVIREYEITDLNFSSKPCLKSLERAKNCSIALSSDMLRATSSIRMLGIENKSIVDPDIRESDLPYVTWRKPHFSLFIWCMIFRILWLFGFKSNGESIKVAKKRAEKCANKLQELAQEHEQVLLVGHGIFNRLIAHRLKKNGWKSTEETGEDYWAYTVYESHI